MDSRPMLYNQIRELEMALYGARHLNLTRKEARDFPAYFSVYLESFDARFDQLQDSKCAWEQPKDVTTAMLNEHCEALKRLVGNFTSRRDEIGNLVRFVQMIEVDIAELNEANSLLLRPFRGAPVPRIDLAAADKEWDSLVSACVRSIQEFEKCQAWHAAIRDEDYAMCARLEAEHQNDLIQRRKDLRQFIEKVAHSVATKN